MLSKAASSRLLLRRQEYISGCPAGFPGSRLVYPATSGWGFTTLLLASVNDSHLSI